ncbi:MAG: zinc finger MYND domain-containing protein [Candidatus Babeliales bacterium]|nr:zinc finger MYND domain-containing protein [Candidatus Babeliales bacterium]
MINLFRSLMLFFFFIPTLCMPFISYNILEKDGKKVLILGDFHNHELDSFNFAHCEHLKKILSDFPGSKKINCFVELRDDEVVVNKKDRRSTAPLTFGKLFIDNNFNVIPADIRTLKAARINNVFSGYRFLLKKVSNFQKVDDDFHERFTANITIKDYLEILNSYVASIEKILEDCMDFDHIKCLDILMNKMDNEIQGLKAKLGSYDTNKLLSEFVLDDIKSCTENLQKALNNVREIVISPNGTFADIGFITSLLNDQKENKFTVICVGNWHAINLSGLLTSIGYKTISEDSCVVKINGLDGLNTEKFIGFMKILEPKIKSFMSELVGFSCKSCKCVKPQNELKICSRCSSVYYCNRECQVSDWQDHKKTCAAKK